MFLFLFCRRKAAAGQKFYYSSENSPPVAKSHPCDSSATRGSFSCPNAPLKRGHPLLPRTCTSPRRTRQPSLPHAAAVRPSHCCHPLLPHTRASSHGSHPLRESIQAQGSDPYLCQRWRKHFWGCRRLLPSSGCRGTSCYVHCYSLDAESSLCRYPRRVTGC